MPFFGKKSYPMQAVMPSIELDYPLNEDWLSVELQIMKAAADSTKQVTNVVEGMASNIPLISASISEFAFLLAHVAESIAPREFDAGLHGQFKEYLSARIPGYLVDLVVDGGTSPDEQSAKTHGFDLLSNIRLDYSDRMERYQGCTEQRIHLNASITDSSVLGNLAGQIAFTADLADNIDGLLRSIRI